MTSPALYPQLFSPSAFQAKYEAKAHHLQICIALPHQLMAGWWIVGAAKIATQARHQTHGLSEPDWLRQSFF